MVSADPARMVGPYSRPVAILGETLMLPLLAVGLGIWLNPLDPLWSREGFPWAWLAPVVLALRYGPFPGLAGAGVLLAAWLAFFQAGWIHGELPKVGFLGGLILVGICGEFSSLWIARARRAEGIQLYLDQRLEHLTRQYYLLRLSHDRLEQDLVTRPVSMRDALFRLNRPLPDHAGAALPGADELLRLLAQYCQIEVASLHAAFAGRIDPVPVTSIGSVSPLDPESPLIRHALERRALTHIASEPEAGDRYLIAAPLSSQRESCSGMLVVERLPFLALTEETLQTLNLLLGYYADGLEKSRIAAPLLARVPDCPSAFAFEIARLWQVRKLYGIASALVVLTLPDNPMQAGLVQLVGRQKRGLDLLWDAPRPQGQRVLAILMPMEAPASAEGYLARIDEALQRLHGRTMIELGIAALILTLDEDMPEQVLERLQGVGHD